MSRQRTWIFLGLLLVSAGCQSKTEHEGPGRTALERRSIDPKAAAALTELQRRYARGDYATALMLADSAAHYAPALADVPYLRGHLYTALNQFEAAEEAYRRTLELDPHYPGVRFRMGNNAFQQRQYRKALSLYQQERDLVAEVLRPEETGASLDPSALPATWLQIGRTYRKIGVVDSARWALEQAIAVDSTYAPAHADLSQLYEDQGEPEQSLRYARRAVSLDPDYFEGRYLLGVQLLRTGQHEEAIPHLEAAAEQRPWFHGALYNLGQALVRAGHTEKAERYLSLADSMQALQHEIDQARVSARQHAQVPQRWIALADVLLRAGRHEEAMRSLEVALTLNPTDLAVQNDVANLSVLLGDTPAAIRRYETILRHDSTFVDTWLNLGVAYARSGRYKEARRAWERVLELAPDHLDAQAYLARLAQMPEKGGE